MVPFTSNFELSRFGTNDGFILNLADIAVTSNGYLLIPIADLMYTFSNTHHIPVYSIALPIADSTTFEPISNSCF